MISRRRVGGASLAVLASLGAAPARSGSPPVPRRSVRDDVAAALVGRGAVGAARRPSVLELRLPRVLLAALAGRRPGGRRDAHSRR